MAWAKIEGSIKLSPQHLLLTVGIKQPAIRVFAEGLPQGLIENRLKSIALGHLR